MLKILDRALAVLLILGGAGHTAGCIEVYRNDPVQLLWALCTSVLIFLLAGLNLLRSGRPLDRSLAWITAAGTAAWLAASVAFGFLIGNLLDFRPAVFVVISTGLLAFSLRTIVLRTSNSPLLM